MRDINIGKEREKIDTASNDDTYLIKYKLVSNTKKTYK